MFLGIDIGTSSVKLVLSRDGRASDAVSEIPLTIQSPETGWMEQQPDSWKAAVQKGCSDLSSRFPDLMGQVAGLGLSGQMHALVCLDETGTPIAPAILWNDNRALPQSAEFEAKVPNGGLRLGVPAMPGLTAPKILWMRSQRPEVFARTKHILNAKDYLGNWLHGQRATDMCDASGMLLLDQAERCWDAQAMDAVGVSESMLPTLSEGTDCAGLLQADIAETLHLPSGIPVAVGGGDVAAGAVGVGAIDPGNAILSLGTSGQIFIVSNRHRPAPEFRVHAFSHCVPNRWSQMAALMNGARPLAWFASVANRGIGELLHDAALARRVPFFLPYLVGERTPHGDSDIRGCFYGMAPDTSDADMMRAVVDGIAYGFADGAAALEHSGSPVVCPIAIGGGTRSDLVLQTLSDVLGISIRRASGSESGPALGAARLAMAASGHAKLEEVALEPTIERTFEPDADRANHHSERLKIYRQLYQALKPVAAQAAAVSGASLAPVMKATASDME